MSSSSTASTRTRAESSAEKYLVGSLTSSSVEIVRRPSQKEVDRLKLKPTVRARADSKAAQICAQKHALGYRIDKASRQFVHDRAAFREYKLKTLGVETASWNEQKYVRARLARLDAQMHCSMDLVYDLQDQLRDLLMEEEIASRRDFQEYMKEG